MNRENAKSGIGNVGFVLLATGVYGLISYWFLTHGRTDMVFVWLGMLFFQLAKRFQQFAAIKPNPESGTLPIVIRDQWLYRVFGLAGALCFLVLVLIELRGLKP